jgi:acyl carrier protein
LRGIGRIAPQEGLRIVGQLLSQSQPVAQVAVLPLNLRQWRQSYPAMAQSPFFSNLTHKEIQDRRQTHSGELRITLQHAEYDECHTLLENYIQEQIQQIIQEPALKIDIRASFQNIGFDSLMALELRNRLENSLGMALPVTLIWTYPTIQALAKNLVSKLTLSPVEEKSEEQNAVVDAEQTALLKEIEDLSEEDAEALLAAELANIGEREML